MQESSCAQELKALLQIRILHLNISANVNPVSLILGRVAFSYHQYYKILSVDFNN